MQASPHGGGIEQVPARPRDAGSDLHGVAADPVDHLEPRLVRQIVADEHRPAPRERRLGCELGDGAALVLAAGLDLDDELSSLQFECVAEACGDGAHFALREVSQGRRQAVVQGERHALVLEHQTRVRRG
jgi:hypothetical protein